MKKSDNDPYFSESSSVSRNRGPRVITRNILQDKKGDFWLATWNGLVRYDGTTFTNLTKQEGLRQYRTFSLMEDRGGTIWIGTTGAGLYRYDGSTYVNLTKEDGLVDNVILSLMQDRDNDIWIGAMSATKYDGTSFTSFTEEDGFTNSDVNSISQADDGRLWFGTRGALFHYNGEVFTDFTKERELNIGSYIPTVIDRHGNLWFGGENGLYHYDGEQVRHVYEPACFSLMEDSNGNIWFSGGVTTPGTSILNRWGQEEGVESDLTLRKQFKVKAGMIFGLIEDKDGNIWMGTTQGIGRIDGDAIRYY